MRRPAPLPSTAEREEPAPWRGPSRSGAGEEQPDTPDPIDIRDPGADEASGEAAPDASVEDAPDDERVLTSRDVWRAARARRKTLRAEIRRFTQRSRRRRMLWLGVTGAILLLIGGSVAAAYSPLFAVRRITVAGASTLDAGLIESALFEQMGTPLALVDESEIKAALMAFPLIESYALEARPPHDLTVRIVERTPVGVLESDAGFTLVDAAGVALSTTPDRPEGQPILNVVGGPGSDAFESVGLVVRSLPEDVRAGVVEVAASTLDDVTITLDNGLVVVWGSAEESVLKAQTLSGVLTAKPDARSIDVSSPLAPVAG
ncbi:cell division protein FtsQ/DivIB [uncultured Microbacterium sp.]|uniref:FtsQ-type POTRA domain-containing protein n=1 Tax=uncultured Microbacterium sp. TaxID=191216 RepID=UPI0026197EC3|nr:FtsQ-type POTRA domain-containing protein [uncultured Microbacterium sp.]